MYLARVENGELKAGWPFFVLRGMIGGRRAVSLPFTDRCRPLLTAPDDLSVFTEQILEQSRRMGLDHLEVRTGFPITAGLDHGFSIHDYYRNFTLDLAAGTDSLWQSFKPKSIRYPINKAESYQLEISRDDSPDDLESFCRMNAQTRQKHGMLPQPGRFFKHIYRELTLKKKAFIRIVKYRRRPIAGSIFLVDRQTVYHKYNASDRNFLKCYPNQYLLWRTIKESCAQGLRYFDLGRTSPDNRGLMAFKRHWGAREEGLPYYYWPDVRGLTSTREDGTAYRILSRIIKRIPIPVLNIMGSLVYRHLG